MYSERAARYQKEVDEKLEAFSSYEDKVEYCKRVDNYLYCEINEDMFSQIINMFDSQL